MMPAMLDKELILHVGLEKTGTTALQRFMQDNSQVLLGKKLVYPVTGRDNGLNHHSLFCNIVPRYASDNPPLSFAKWQRHISELIEEVKHLDASKVVLSSEMLVQDVDFEHLRMLTRHFSKTTVVLYLRPQESYLASLYAQRVKSVGEHRSFDLNVLPDADFYKLCKDWAALVDNSGELHVRRYGSAYEHGGTVLNDFIDKVVGLDLNEDFEIYKHNLNPRLSADCHEFKRVLNTCLPKKLLPFLISPLERYSREVDAGNAEFYSKYSLLTEEGSRIIREKYEKSNAAVAKEFLQLNGEPLFIEASASSNKRQETEGLTGEKALTILAFLSEHFESDRPEVKSVPGIAQRCIFSGLSQLTQNCVDGLEKLNCDHPFTGPTLELTPEFMRKTLQIKLDLMSKHAGH